MAITYEPIATTTLNSTQSTVTFSSISGSHTDLVLVMNPITNDTNGAYPYLRFNSDSSTNYGRIFMRGNGSSASSDESNNENLAYIIGGNVAQLNSAFNAIVNIQNYANTTTFKSYISRANSATGTDASVEAVVGMWRSTSAINNITITCGGTSFVSGSTFTLYGITKA